MMDLLERISESPFMFLLYVIDHTDMVKKSTLSFNQN